MHPGKRINYFLSSKLALAIASAWFVAIPFANAQGVNPFLGMQGVSSQPGTSPSPVVPQAQAPGVDPQVKAHSAVAAPVVAMSSGSATGQGGISLRFDNADVYDVIQAILGDVLNVDYVIDPAVQGKVTLRSTQLVQKADALGVLQSALSQLGVLIAKSPSGGYKVVKDSNLARESLPKTEESPHAPVMRVIPMRFAQAAQVAATLKPFASAGSVVIPDPTNKYLIVADRASVVERLEALADTIDNQLLRDVNVRLFRAANADPADLARELEAVFKTSGLFAQPNTDLNRIYVLPIARLGALLVASSSQVAIETAEKWFTILDAIPSVQPDATVHVYPVANGNAQHLAGILQQIFGVATSSNSASSANRTLGSSTQLSGAPTTTNAANGLPAAGSATGATATGGAAAASNTGAISRGNVPQAVGAVVSGQAGLAGPIAIIPDEVTNTIVIRASANDYIRVKKVLEKIDTLPKQVLIQVVVAEVALNDTLQYGVEWWMNSMLSRNGKTWAATAGLDGLFRAPTVGSVTGTSTGFNYAVLNGSSQVIGLLNLLGKDTNVNLLSAPHVLAADGKLAKVEIGNDEPVVTQTVQTPATTTGNLTTSNSVQYRPTGLILEVKPTISATGVVSMAISQEVSSRTGSVVVGGSEYPNFSKRRVTTDVAVQEGKSLLIAGLIEDKGDDASVGLPGIKDIPVFGALFGTTKRVKAKTELLITITPHVIRQADDVDRLATEFGASLTELKGVIAGGRNTLLPGRASVRGGSQESVSR